MPTYSPGPSLVLPPKAPCRNMEFGGRGGRRPRLRRPPALVARKRWGGRAPRGRVDERNVALPPGLLTDARTDAFPLDRCLPGRKMAPRTPTEGSTWQRP